MTISFMPLKNPRQVCTCSRHETTFVIFSDTIRRFHSDNVQEIKSKNFASLGSGDDKRILEKKDDLFLYQKHNLIFDVIGEVFHANELEMAMTTSVLYQTSAKDRRFFTYYFFDDANLRTTLYLLRTFQTAYPTVWWIKIREFGGMSSFD